MLVQRQAEAAAAPASEHVQTAPETPAPETAQPETSPETPTAPPTETAQATPEAPAPEAPAPDDVLSQLSPEQKKGIEKRIAKETAKTKALEAQIELLKAAQARNAPPATPIPTTPILQDPSSPLANIFEPAELEKVKKSALEAKDWAQEQLDNGVTEAKVGSEVYDTQRLKSVVRNADKVVSREIPERAQFLNVRQQAERQTAEIFGASDWFKDKQSEGYKVYQNILSDPDVAKRAGAPWVAAIQVQGLIDVQRNLRARGKETELPAQPPPKQRPPASQTATGAGLGPNREPGQSKAVKELTSEMEILRKKKGISGRDAEAYLRKLDTARSTR